MNLRSGAIARYFCFSLALLVLEPLRCGGPVPELPAAQFPPTIVIVEGKTTQGFPYLSGGVSSDEREVMEERDKSYNVKLMFAAKTDAYLTAACSFTEKIASASKTLRLFSSLTPSLTSCW
jgi:hypothetical protein